ncbi:hypothetical protein Vafri_17620 [Volvox africanus]|uniref:Uncharacterized protein n=1 Tax=Volvox africanus TaxID=51714 RepID=A0A8J4BLD7_9CHLO|nr:hypothetical protein Vafri_17620 [Volvox africanus]
MPLVPTDGGHPAFLRLCFPTDDVNGWWSPAGPLRTRPSWLAPAATVAGWRPLRALFLVLLLLVLFGTMEFSSSLADTIGEEAMGWSAPSVGVAAPVAAAIEGGARAPALAVVAAVVDGRAAGTSRGRPLPRAPSKRSLPEGLPTAFSQSLQVLMGYQDVVTARALAPLAAEQRNIGTIQIQHRAQRQRHASVESLKQSQPQLQSQLQLRIAPCSDILAWAMEAALLPLDRPPPPRFTAPYEHCIQPGGELKALAAAVADEGEGSEKVKTGGNWMYDNLVTGNKAAETAKPATLNPLDSNSVPFDDVVPCTDPEQPLRPQSALAMTMATADPRSASLSAAAVGQTGASWIGSTNSTWEADTDTEAVAVEAEIEAERDSLQLPSRSSHTRSLLQFFVQGSLPVARTSIDIPNDFKIVGLLGLALFQMQDTAGRNRSANTALATTFQGAGFPFGVSFSLTNDFGGSTQHNYRFGTATDTRGAAADGLQTGRAVSTVPFGDVNVVTNILSAALAQRRIVQLKPPPPSPLSSSWEHQSEGKHHPLRFREAEQGQEEILQIQHQPHGIHSRNATGGDIVADATAREVDISGTTTVGNGGGGGSGSSNRDGRNHTKGDTDADIDVDALLAEYDYWNGYLYPFYNIEYDMSYNDYDLHGGGDIAAEMLPGATRDSGDVVGSTGEADNGNRSGGSGGGQVNLSGDKYRTLGSKLNNNNGSTPYTAYLYDPFDVLMATTLEYGRAGQYDYFYAEFYRFLSNYYSGPQIVPNTALARTRGTSAAVRDNQATTSGSSKNAATGLNVAATVQSISAAIRGVSQSLRQQDIIGNDTFTGAPQEPARQSGVVASGLSFGRGYFFQAPSEAYLAAGTTANVARGGGKTAGAGGWSVGFASGNKYSGSRSNIFAQSGSQNLAFDVAG